MEKFRSNLLAFIDLLFQILIGITVMWWFSTLLIHDPGKKKIDTVAEILVTLKWPNEIPNDMDLWVIDPAGRIEGYPDRSQGSGFMSLERDDLGHSNDTFVVNGQRFIVKENSEVMTIRKAAPGEYGVSVHFFSSSGRHLPTPVEVRVIQVNPEFKIVYAKAVIIDTAGDESFMFRFYVNDKGVIDKIEEEPPSHFVIGGHHSLGKKVFKPNSLQRNIEIKDPPGS